MTKKRALLIFFVIFCGGYAKPVIWLAQAIVKNDKPHIILRLERTSPQDQNEFVDVEKLDSVLTTPCGGEYVIDVNALDDAGFTRLHRAVQNKSPEQVHFLLAYGACVNVAEDFERQTPLHLAVLLDVPVRDRINLLNLLMAGNGANINQQDAYGNTILHYAALFHRGELIKWLLDHQANKDICNAYNFTPLGLYILTNKFAFKNPKFCDLKQEIKEVITLFLGYRPTDKLYQSKVRDVLGEEWVWSSSRVPKKRNTK